MWENMFHRRQLRRHQKFRRWLIHRPHLQHKTVLQVREFLILRPLHLVVVLKYRWGQLQDF